MSATDVRDLEGRAVRFLLSCVLGFPSAWMVAVILPTRPGVSGGGVSLALILTGAIALSLAWYGVLGIVAAWRRRARQGLAMAIARYRR